MQFSTADDDIDIGCSEGGAKGRAQENRSSRDNQNKGKKQSFQLNIPAADPVPRRSL